MDLYSMLREFADSWMLLAMTGLFLGVVLWAFRPGSAEAHRESAAIPFRHEDRPACGRNCATCACKADLIMPEDVLK